MLKIEILHFFHYHAILILTCLHLQHQIKIYKLLNKLYTYPLLRQLYVNTLYHDADTT